jgi:CRP-like cAMP-binding protein
MDETVFESLLTRMPSLSLNLVRILSERLRRVTSQAQALATLDASGRVARQLLLFGQQYGEPLPGGGTIIPIRLKQGDLAGMVGASREKVNRILGHFKSQGYISITSESYTVIQRAEPLAKMLR